MLYPRSRWLRYPIYFVCLLLVVGAADMFWANSRRTIHPRYDTTRITQPRLDDGTIDYLTAIETRFSQGVTAENNSFPVMLEALGRVALPKTQPPDGITGRLGMPPLPEKGDYFVNYADFSKADGSNSKDLPSEDGDIPESESATRPSSTVDQWLAANERPLAKIHEASLRTRYFVPFNGGNRPEMLISVLLPHLSPLRQIAQALAIRSHARAAAGDVAGARDDAMTMHRLARLLGQAPTLIERIVAIAIDINACKADRAIAATGKMSAGDLRDYATELSAMGDLEGAVPAIDGGERYIILDTTQRMAHMSPTQAGRLFQSVSNSGATPPAEMFPFLPIPYEQAMISANAWYDGLLAALRQPTYAQRHEAIERWSQGVFEVSRGNFLSSPDSVLHVCFADWALRLFMPSLSRFQTRWETDRAQLRLTQVALLLAGWKLDHQDYPA
ncbi:MAG TPA: hypothetical protein VFW23_10035, partial [Tepidisphaeraceae bacterium]|nr:hypothetical protein [Tepidisphaeraceae bacterium]